MKIDFENHFYDQSFIDAMTGIEELMWKRAS
jgi:hypothetical protein